MKRLILAIAMTMAMFMGSACTFNQEVKDYSAAYTPIHSAVLLSSTIQLKHLKSVVERYVERAKEEVGDPDVKVYLEMENPAYDPTDPESEPIIYILADDYINEIQATIDGLMELMEGQELLNESLQADEGLKPLINGVKELLSDEELIELIRKYGPLIIRGKTTE